MKNSTYIPIVTFAVLFALILFPKAGFPNTTNGTKPDNRINLLNQTISENDDASKILGKPLQLRNFGEPVQVSQKLRETLNDVYTEPGDLPQLKVEVDGKKLNLPLKHTHVKANVTGYVAQVEVTQTYQNPFEYPIEAIYIFPLPENSSVNDMKMVIGNRTIEADIKKRAEARKTYEAAKNQGHTAALLEQERPNIFTQSVANIEPGTDIDVVINYMQNLTYDSGEYEFVFPMVVGPRFIPGNPTGTQRGVGWSPDTDEVTDASRISPPILGGGLRSGHDISLEITANAGLPITTWDVPTHQVVETKTIDGTLQLKLKKDDSIPNRDFVLKYKVDGKQAQVALLKSEQGYFSLIVQPPRLNLERLVGQREIIFVVDVSGSMHGVPLSMCKDAMQEALKNLRPVDTFNVITFESRTGKVFNQPRPANDTNVKAAIRFVDGLRAGGGTMMGLGVSEALNPPVEQGRHRYVFFMTDGYIGNERTILKGTRDLIKKLESRRQLAKVFSFGTGSSVNRHLLDGLARAGRGIAVYSSTREDPTLAVNKFFRIIDHPIIKDVEVDWGDLQVQDIFPARLPDLFASRPIIAHGRFTKDIDTKITVKGKINNQTIELPLTVKKTENIESSQNEYVFNKVLRTLWARAKVDWLDKDLTYHGQNQQVVNQITNIGLKYRLVTAYTSFVAVDRSKTVDGKLHTILQPVETPEGVNPQMAGARLVKRSYGGLSKSRKYGSKMAKIAPRRYRTKPAPSAMEDSLSYTPQAPGRIAYAPKKSVKRIRSKNQIFLQGSLSKQDVVKIIHNHRNDIIQCFIKAFGSGKKPTGKITIRWYITATGKAIQVKVINSTIQSNKLYQLIIKEIKSWQFPKPKNSSPVKINYTFDFSH